MPDSRANLHVILASTRQGRLGPKVAAWFLPIAVKHGKFTVELVDLAAVNLPLLDEPEHPALRKYQHEHTKAWSALVARADAFVVVILEYDFGPPASLVNALQYLFHEWNYKALGFVSYGGVSGGSRSTQGLRVLATALKMMPMFESVTIPFFKQYIDKETGVFSPGEVQEKAAVKMLEELGKWVGGMRGMRG